MVDNLLTVQVYNQSKILNPSKGSYLVDLFDDKGHKISESKINIRGQAYFWNLKVGYYTFKAIDAKKGLELGILNVIVDGTNTNFAIIVNHDSYSTIESISKHIT